MAGLSSRLLFVLFIFALNTYAFAGFKNAMRRRYENQQQVQKTNTTTTTSPITTTGSSDDSNDSSSNDDNETSNSAEGERKTEKNEKGSNEKIDESNAEIKENNREAIVESNVANQVSSNKESEKSNVTNEESNNKGIVESNVGIEERNNEATEKSNVTAEITKEINIDSGNDNKNASEVSEIVNGNNTDLSEGSRRDTSDSADNETKVDLPLSTEKLVELSTIISPVDEIGKQILESKAIDTDEYYFCPCDKSVYDSLNLTKRTANMDGKIINSITNDEKSGKQNNDHQTPFSYGGDALKTSCGAIFRHNLQSPSASEYIWLPGRQKFKVRCIPDKRPECSWTVIMERKTKHDDFDLDWSQYRKGFGDPDLNEAFFVGLENVFTLTHLEDLELYFHTHFEGEDLEHEIYRHFMIGNEESSYEIIRLNIVSNNTMVRRLRLGSIFTTNDRDTGTGLSKCATQFGMGWWYSKRCKYASSLSSIRAFVKSPTTMAVRLNRCGERL